MGTRLKAKKNKTTTARKTSRLTKRVSKTRRAKLAPRARRQSKPRSKWTLRKILSALSSVFMVGMIAWGLHLVFDQKPNTLPNQPTTSSNVSLPLASEFQAASKMTMGERVAFWSEIVLQSSATRKTLASLPDAPKINDDAPLVPTQFDCTTFVETISALSRSKTSQEFFSNLVAIRYKNSNSSYLGRNHFPEADWIPNNTHAGILQDTTQLIAQRAAVQMQYETKTIDRGTWLMTQWRRGKIQRSVASTTQSPAHVSVPYITLDDTLGLLKNIPNGSIVNIVRKNSPRQPVIITHQGFIIQASGTTYIRHSTPNGSIQTLPLKTYIEKIRKARWEVIGLNFNELKG